VGAPRPGAAPIFKSLAREAARGLSGNGGSPGKAAFIVRASRTITGRVLSYDSAVGLYVPVVGTEVILRESGPTAVTDLNGRYLFRDLAAGTYTISVRNRVQTSTHTVVLGGEPVALINVDFQISSPRPPAAALQH
jgi:hypothetical protein